MTGQGDLEPAYFLALKDVGVLKLGTYEKITAGIEIVDKKGQTYRVGTSSAVEFIKREERVAQKEGYKVLEKYALILFDFDSAQIKAHNRNVLDRITARIKAIPTAKVTISGHTDSIGKETYNLSLSESRAKSAYDNILAGGVQAGDNITYKGSGLHDPLYNNELPEGRALNRTVTVTLEYEQEQ